MCFRIIPKNVLYLVRWKTVKSQSDLILGINPNASEPSLQSEWIRSRIDPNRIFNRNHSKLSRIEYPGEKIALKLTPIHYNICIRANTNHYELIRKKFCILFDE